MSNYWDLLSGKKLRQADQLGNQLAQKIRRQQYGWNYHRPKHTGEVRNPVSETDKKRLDYLEHLRDKTERETTKARMRTALAGMVGLGAATGAGIGTYKQTAPPQEVEKNASVKKFFTRLGDLYKGGTQKRLKKLKNKAGKQLTRASTNKSTKQSVVDNFNSRFDNLSKAHAAEAAKRTGLYGMTGVAGLSGYHGFIKDKK